MDNGTQLDYIADLIADRDRWRAIAERAMANCDRCEAEQEPADEIERLREDRHRWAEFAFHISNCPNWGKRTCWDCVSPSNQDQARQAGLERVIREEYGK